MDTFNYMVSLILIMLAMQFEQNWLVFAVVGITILSMRSASATIILIITALVVYLMRAYLKEFWLVIVFGLIILSFVLGSSKSEAAGQPDYYAGDPYGGLMGGM